MWLNYRRIACFPYLIIHWKLPLSKELKIKLRILSEKRQTKLYICNFHFITPYPTGNLDMDVVKKKFGVHNVFRVMVLVCDWLNRDENIQVNGLVGFIDCTNMTMKHHLNLMNMENGKKMMQFYQVLHTDLG